MDNHFEITHCISEWVDNLQEMKYTFFTVYYTLLSCSSSSKISWPGRRYSALFILSSETESPPLETSDSLTRFYDCCCFVTLFLSAVLFLSVKDAFKAPQRSVDKPFRLCVSDVFKGTIIFDTQCLLASQYEVSILCHFSKLKRLLMLHFPPLRPRFRLLCYRKDWGWLYSDWRQDSGYASQWN